MKTMQNFLILFSINIFIIIHLGKANDEVFLINENNPMNLSLSLANNTKYIFYPTESFTSKEFQITFSPLSLQSSIGHIKVEFSPKNNFSELNPDQICEFSSFFVCIHSFQKYSNQVYILITCLSEKCEIFFRLSHIEEIYLTNRRVEHIAFKRGNLEKVNFTIPGKQDFARIVLSISYKYRNSHLTSEIEYYQDLIQFSNGNHHKYKMFDRQVFTFSNNDETLCYNCNITVKIYGQEDSYIELELFIYQSKTLAMFLDVYYIDYLAPSKNNNYLLTIDEKLISSDFNLLISINSLSGKHKTLYLNVDTEPNSVDNFHWRTSSINSYHEEEDIVVTKRDLEYFNLIGRMYFLTVTGDSEGLYSLFITANQDKIIPLQFGIKETGLIINEELIYYRLQLWNTADVQDEITLSATMTHGHIAIYGKNCGDNLNCSVITMEDIKFRKNIDYQVQEDSIATLIFKPSCKYSYCFYLFAILGKSSSTVSSKYDLFLKKDDTYINLIENKCHESAINYLDKEHFKLTVTDSSEEITSVSFFINSDLQYMVSQEKNCENEDCNVYLQGNLNNAVIFENDVNQNISFAGVYFMTVFGVRSGEFIIFPEVKRKSENEVYINLLEGKFIKYFLTSSKPRAYFEFLIDIYEQVSIEINLQSNTFDNLRIYLTRDNSKPSPDNYFMSSTNNYLTFEHSTSYETIYKVLIETKSGENLQNNNDFAIMFSTEKSMKHLMSNQPFYDSIGSGDIKKFLFYIDLESEIVYFTKHAINPEEGEKFLKMTFSHLSFEQTVEPEPTFSTSDSTIKLNKDNLNVLCSMKLNQFKKICPIYIIMKNEYFQDIHYVLNARTKEFAIPVTFGKEQIVTMNEEENFINMFILVPGNSIFNPVEIYLYSLKFTFHTYVSLYNNVGRSHYIDWQFPNKTTQNYIIILNRLRVSVVLTEKDFQTCSPGCVILVTIQKENRIKNSIYQEDLLHILASNGFSEINDNKLISFKSEENNDKFFKYNTNRLIQMNLSLLIDMTNLVGASEIYIKISDGSNEVGLPDKTNYDFFSFDGHLTITCDTILSKVPSDTTKAAYLLFGVQCLNPICENSLLVRTSNQYIRKAFHGYPHEISVESQSSIFFEYFHPFNKSFQIKMNKESGKADLYIIPCFEKLVEQCLSNHYQNKYMHSFSSSSIKINKEDSENYCTECIYLIVFSAVDTNLKGSFNIVLDREFLLLPDGYKFYDEVAENEENLYSCKAPSKESLDIKVNLYYNEPILYASRRKNKYKNNFEYMITKKQQQGFSLTLDPEEKSSYEDFDDEVYIMIYGKSASNYTISCKSSTSYGIIHPGLIEYDELKPIETKRYIYYSDGKISSLKQLRLTISYIHENGPCFNVSIWLKFIKFHDNVDTNLDYQEIKLKDSDKIYSMSSESYIIDYQEGVYKFNLTNKLNKNVKFIFSLQTDETTILPFDTIIDIVLISNHSNYYETYVPKKGLFLLDLVECIGNIEVFTADSYKKMINKEFDQEFIVFSGRQNLKILKANQGPLFLSFQISESISQLNQNIQGYGQVSTHLYDIYDDIPQMKLIMPQDGEIIWKVLEETNGFLDVNVVFNSVVCDVNCDDDYRKNINIIYKLSVSSSSFSNMNGQCLISNISGFIMAMSNNNSLEKETKPLTLNVKLSTSITDKPVYFNIIASVEGIPEHYSPVSLYYKESGFQKPGIIIKKLITYGVSFGIVCLIIFFAICACFYYGGYKKLLKRLRFGRELINEDENTINTVGLATSIEMKSTD